MRILRFIVEGQSIKPDPSCDFDGLFPGKNDDIQVEFEFSHEWTDMVKVVGFWSMMGVEYSPQMLDEYDSCAIPIEALAKPAFKMQVFGKHRGGIFQTDKITIYQRGGAK